MYDSVASALPSSFPATSPSPVVYLPSDLSLFSTGTVPAAAEGCLGGAQFFCFEGADCYAEALELEAPETDAYRLQWLRDPLMLLCRICHQLNEVLVLLYHCRVLAI
jgi:hypothetical protein